jgi:stage V sporulation protein R
MKNNPFASDDWTSESLSQMWDIIRKIAVEEFKLDFYEPYFEVVTFEEMLQIYTTGFPIMFNHWTFGKQYESLYKQYKNNRASIAYEVIFNTNPSLCYLLETNSTTMQALVMSHAACGHSAFFKNNEFMRENTNAKTITSFLKNMRSYVQECERLYGEKRVEEILDVCSSLTYYAIDRSEYIDLTRKEKEQKRINRKVEQDKDFDLKVEELGARKSDAQRDIIERQKDENIVKFIARYSPILKPWERELMLMFCKVQQYFYPQIFTKLMNEGYASFWHYQLMNRLYDLGYISEGSILEFIHSHTSVLCQHDHDSKYYSGLNPYKLGYEIFNDIKRICTEPTEEDKRFSPGLIGKDWVEEVHFAANNFKDESFILQYLTPKVVRDFKLFKYTDDTDEDFYTINAVHSDEDFKEIRKEIAKHYNFFNRIPQIYVEGADLKRSRALYMVYKHIDGKEVNVEEGERTFAAIKKLWPFPLKLRIDYSDGSSERKEVNT